MALIKGCPGGAQAAVTATAVAVDLTALVRHEVMIWSDDQDLWFCFAVDNSSTTLVTSGASAASLTSLVADRVAVGTGVRRFVNPRYPVMIVKTVSGSGTLKVKVISDEDLSQ